MTENSSKVFDVGLGHYIEGGLPSGTTGSVHLASLADALAAGGVLRPGERMTHFQVQADRIQFVVERVGRAPDVASPTAHVYAGAPDGRQALEPIATSRFRPRYRALTDQEKGLHDRLKEKAVELEQLVLEVKEGRYRSLGMTSLEQAVMWVVKELTA